MTTKPAASAFPLHWPSGWTRTPVHRRSRSKYKQTAASALTHLQGEIHRLGGRQVIISTNVPLRRDGTHYVDDGNFEDPGVAVYWTVEAMAALNRAIEEARAHYARGS